MDENPHRSLFDYTENVVDDPYWVEFVQPQLDVQEWSTCSKLVKHGVEIVLKFQGRVWNIGAFLSDLRNRDFFGTAEMAGNTLIFTNTVG